jgi:putative tricarboxylic transport membrane protein
MEAATYQKRRAYLALGSVGIVFATLYVAASIQLPLGQLDRPGAGIFPIGVGLVLLVASFCTLREGWCMAAANSYELPRGRDRFRILALIALLLGFFFALPWLGQIVSSTIFCILLMRILSNLSWIRIVIYSIVLSLAIDLAFEVLLKVPLPQGVLPIVAF